VFHINTERAAGLERALNTSSNLNPGLALCDLDDRPIGSRVDAATLPTRDVDTSAKVPNEAEFSYNEQQLCATTEALAERPGLFVVREHKQKSRNGLQKNNRVLLKCSSLTLIPYRYAAILNTCYRNTMSGAEG
jgi:hypothetical protein